MNRIAFAVLSCDNYSDLWNDFSCLFSRHWPDCPFDKYFISNHNPFAKFGFKPITTGDDESWSDGLIKALCILKEKYDYVFLTLEDLYLLEDVDSISIEKCINEFIRNDGNYLRLYQKREYKLSGDRCFSELSVDDPYRINCVFSIWKIDVLLNILKSEENAWQFEKEGRIRSNSFDKFYVSNKNYFTVSNTVVKGLWVPSELRRIKRIIDNHNINRPVMSEFKAQKLELYTYLYRLFFKIIPISYQSILITKYRNLKK